MPAELIASWERSWSDAGLGSYAVHMETDDPAGARALTGESLCTPIDETLYRFDPSMDLETFAALLEASGWTVDWQGETSLDAKRT